ncbi:MAG TPA: serine/threonine-protein kinase, partial [Polyangiaceae bacterium]|nr:serine/threonine-protein kinase [Polyangiaceae bacterium]
MAMPETSQESGLLKQGRYRIVGLLGRGAQADTLWAEDAHTGTQVAIKRFQVRGAKSWKDVELAEREASVLSRLSHKNLPRYIDHFEEDGALYLVMEKIEGKTLAQLRERGALDQASVRRLLAELGETLEYLHGLSPPIVHRDIKPQNVILRGDGGFSLVDFGSVRDKLRPEGGSTVVGTFGYMAPEQFQGRAGPSTDVYGAGATALACLTGSDPENLPHKGLSIDVPAALAGHVDASMVQLLSRLVEPDPDKRPRSLTAALREAAPARRSAPPRSNAEAASRADRIPPFDVPSMRLSRRQLRRLEKERRKEAKRARRSARRAQRLERLGNRVAHFPGWFWVLLVLGITLFVVRIVLGGLLRIALPILLSVLAIVFGPALRRAVGQSL